MGSLRFRKQFKLAPGLKLPLNKQSVGITTGVAWGEFDVQQQGPENRIGGPAWDWSVVPRHQEGGVEENQGGTARLAREQQAGVERRRERHHAGDHGQRGARSHQL